MAASRWWDAVLDTVIEPDVETCTPAATAGSPRPWSGPFFGNASPA
jgi:hypothetical protein